ncbi:Dimer-Tnp-hAT domain containing protein [Pyrenophora tritici-repentis]|nr:Dimer-Tnp-hAT domain containing protein [Pyrenophora tritici-repentis]
MAKRRLPQTSARSKRTKVAAATNNANASPPIPTFELQFLESQAEAEIVAPTEGSRAGTVATTEAGEGGQDETNSALVENFDGIDWARLPDFIKPLARSKRPKSWIFQYGYRVVERHATSRIWFVCKYCHVHKTIDAGRGYNLSSHPSQPTKAWPQPYERWPKVSAESSRPAVVAASFDAGLDVQQNTANAFGNFDVEGFRTATVMWLVNRNHPLSELTTPDFREMMRFANPEAEAALWVSNTSVSTFVMRLFRSIRPQVIDTLSGSVSKIHVSFDGWTTKGGKRGFFGVVAHFADAAGIIRDLPIDLPELAGAHTDAYGNTQEQYNTEEQYMREWRKDGPIGVLVDVINYIKTPQQYELFVATSALPTTTCLLKGVSKYSSQSSLSSLAGTHTMLLLSALPSFKPRITSARRPKLDEINWARAADWAVIAEYQDCLEPLKYATKRLEDALRMANTAQSMRLYPFLSPARPFEHVDFNAHAEAPEDHLNVNLRAAWSKANDYYNKLDDSPAYYAAVCLHPYYKNYCDVAWADKADWLTSANASFQQLWAAYKPQRARQRYTTAPSSNNIDEAIIAILSRNNDREAPLDEFERWKTQEPQWTQEQYNADGNPVQYWIQLLPKYPHLAQFAIDIMTIPASSSDCERLFSELGDLLEPKRRALGSELLAALQLVRSWVRAGYKPYNCSEAKLSDEQLVGDYNILEWNTEFW